MILTTETLNSFEQSLVNSSSDLVKFVITVTQTQVDESTIRFTYSSTTTINQLNTLIVSGKTPVFIINSTLDPTIEYYYSMLFIASIYNSETFGVKLISNYLDSLSAVDADSPLSKSVDTSVEGGGKLA
jgi:hypothetical protein